MPPKKILIFLSIIFVKNEIKHRIFMSYNYQSWWLHANENPSSILSVVSGHLCTFLLIKTYVQTLFILLGLCQKNITIRYHTNIKHSRASAAVVAIND